MASNINAVSEYLNNDAAFKKFVCVDKASVVNETEKAVCVKGIGFNRSGNECEKSVWFPKSQIVNVKNDHYTQASPEMMLIPRWLVMKNGVDVA